MSATARPPLFPFAALVGLDTLKLALQLAAIDARLSVLVRGDKGAGKTTAARGLAALLAPGSPFVTLPIGATEDRLLGGLDLERALKGEPALKPGVLADAHGGVLYIDEVNLLPDHLADALLDAVASGLHVVEREGFSVTQATDFVMVGSMNPEEGSLRPQLLDRFALAVDVEAPLDPAARGEVLARRLHYDTNPAGFADEWSEESAALRQTLADARARVADLALSRDLLQHIATRVAAYGIRSLRADLAVMRACRAYAALEGAMTVDQDHVERVLPLAIAHRARGLTPASSQAPARDPDSQPPQDDGSRRSRVEDERRDNWGEDSQAVPAQRVFAPADFGTAPRLLIDRTATATGTATSRGHGETRVPRGPVIGARATVAPHELDTRASLIHAATRNGDSGESGGVSLHIDDLHEKTRAPQGDTRFIVIVDSSGSHAVQDRMGLVKGAIAALLDASHRRHDEMVVIACRGAVATVLVDPTSSRADVERALEYLPTGGRTPLAHALELAAGYVTDRALVVLVTDGHANVPHRSDDAWADALTAARAIGCPALVVDSEDTRRATGRPREMAEAMGATYTRLTELDQTNVLRIVRGNA
jgi:magnesium chelatase subunit D